VPRVLHVGLQLVWFKSGITYIGRQFLCCRAFGCHCVSPQSQQPIRLLFCDSISCWTSLHVSNAPHPTPHPPSQGLTRPHRAPHSQASQGTPLSGPHRAPTSQGTPLSGPHMASQGPYLTGHPPLRASQDITGPHEAPTSLRHLWDFCMTTMGFGIHIDGLQKSYKFFVRKQINKQMIIQNLSGHQLFYVCIVERDKNSHLNTTLCHPPCHRPPPPARPSTWAIL